MANYIHNRMELYRKLLKDNGINITAINDIELRYLTVLQDNVFGKNNYITTIITKCNPQGRVADKISKTYRISYTALKKFSDHW
ncbi:hypothetical protein AGMMS5026_09690 [Endomicrobiia bacterium]|nr:hypothetical protein AGMMS49523_04360 [Endomicrobiia bacterium]GHT13911.1 hypothetical protein AGMMS49571_08530 [Endomicrobiia bacterium]GHT19341.1 hypothetical protein AGMMS49929_02830 [Endomicrobiia bacterium]GHT26930.1 hypothetical protein AGMMS49995_04680 [Endomicrobiia bacterium]GHT32138.1 hypothetical protein AGMMS5026_09690 [Endomicrobiia bacterium]